MAPIFQQKRALSAAQRKIDSHLWQTTLAIKDKVATGKAVSFQSMSTPLLKIDSAGAIQVKLTVTGQEPSQIRQLKELGMAIGTTLPQYGIVEGTVPYSQIESVAALGFVTNVASPGYAIHNTGAVTSAGDTILRAADARGAFGVDGSAIKVGVMSDGVSHLTNSVTSGDLPPSVDVRPGQAGSGDEGTAMLEIVHDLAPGAGLAFYSPTTSSDMVTGIANLATAGCKIVVDDVIFSDEPKFEDGPVAQAARQFYTNGGIYVTSAGNNARGHYQHQYVQTSGPGGDYLYAHDYGGGDVGNTMTIPAGTTVQAVLQWNNRCGQSADDLDFFLIKSSDGTVLDFGAGPQDGTQNPDEYIYWNNYTGSAVTAYLAVLEYHLVSVASSLILDYNVWNWNGPALQYSNPANSVIGHSAVAEVLSTAAASVASPNSIEAYSSQGPGTVYFPTQQDRQVPNITGVDGVETKVGQTGYFYNPFYGTSAAAPHIAAVAALVWSANPTLNSTEVFSAITSSAVDQGAAGYDYAWGFGLADGYQAVQKVARLSVATGAATDLTETSATLNGRLLGIGPLGSANVSFQWGTVSGAYTANTSIHTTNSTGVFTAALSGLAADTNYYFRARASNNTTAYGEESTFRTLQLPPPFLLKSGSNGSGDGQFFSPSSVAFDSAGNVYVADNGNNRVEKFTSTGQFLTKWGSYGTGDGQLWDPWGVAVDASGNVYVLDTGNSRVEKFTSSGVFVGKWGSSGSGDGSFNQAEGIAVDSSGNVYVGDSGNNRIQKFSSSGTFIAKWGSNGNAAGQFLSPRGIAFDSDGNIYVADTFNSRIQKFSSSGVFIAQWAANTPTRVAVEASGAVYVSDPLNNRVRKFNRSGALIATFGSFGQGDGQFNQPCGIAITPAGTIYVADYSNSRIQAFGQPPPTGVTTDDASDITINSAQLNGTLLSLGGSTSANVSFEWGLTAGYGNNTTSENRTGLGTFGANITGLAPNNVYHYRAKAVGTSTAYGLDKSFATLSGIPSVTTDNTSGITINSAQLNGTLGSLNGATSANVSFEWGLTTGYGDNVTSSNNRTSLGTFSANITGLSPYTTYHFRAKGVGSGTSFGLDKTFTTAFNPPAVTTDNATADLYSARLSGTLTDKGTATSANVSFLWGASQSNLSNNSTIQTMTGPGAFGANITGLSPAVTYFYQAQAVGHGSPVLGSVKSFTTLSTPPTVATDNATVVGPYSARLNGNLTDRGTANSVSVFFQYGTTSGTYTVNTTAQFVNATGPFQFDVTGLSANTTYYFRAYATGHSDNSGEEKRFTTMVPVAPSVTTDNASNVSYFSGRVSGNLTSLGTAPSANVSFLWGTASGNLTSETSIQAMGAQGPFYCDLTVLSANTTYYYRAKAAGHLQPVLDEEKSFTTLVTMPPSAITYDAASVTQSTAALSGNLTSMGTSSPVSVSFQWGTMPGSYSYETTAQPVSAAGVFNASLTGLSPSMVYYFRAKAAGAAGHCNGYGNEKTFTTLAIPPPPGGGGLSGGGGGGGGVVGAGVTNIVMYTNSDGLFNLPAIIKSDDAKASLSIARGVLGRTKDDLALKSIKIAPPDSPPTGPTDRNMIGLAYEITPEGATFTPSITLTLVYDPAKLPANTDPDSITIMVYNTTSSTWDPLKSVVNKADGSASADIQHFSVYALAGKTAVPPTTPPAPAQTTTPVSPTTQPAPPPTTTPAPTTAQAQAQPPPASTTPATEKPVGSSGPLIIGIVAAVLVIGLIAFFLVQARRRRAKGSS